MVYVLVMLEASYALVDCPLFSSEYMFKIIDVIAKFTLNIRYGHVDYGHAKHNQDYSCRELYETEVLK